jgi:hypothetical protein
MEHGIAVLKLNFRRQHEEYAANVFSCLVTRENGSDADVYRFLRAS